MRADEFAEIAPAALEECQSFFFGTLWKNRDEYFRRVAFAGHLDFCHRDESRTGRFGQNETRRESVDDFFKTAVFFLIYNFSTNVTSSMMSPGATSIADSIIVPNSNPTATESVFFLACSSPRIVPRLISTLLRIIFIS